jgi:hypothetical protein
VTWKLWKWTIVVNLEKEETATPIVLRQVVSEQKPCHAKAQRTFAALRENQCENLSFQVLKR